MFALHFLHLVLQLLMSPVLAGQFGLMAVFNLFPLYIGSYNQLIDSLLVFRRLRLQFGFQFLWIRSNS